MNIEEANDNLIMLKYFLQEEGDENWEKYCEAIETLLTAYEKEKEKNKRYNESDYEDICLENKYLREQLEICQSDLEEMTGIDLSLSSKEE